MTTTAATKRIVGYRRVSTAGQAGERHVSLPTQEQHIARYADNAGSLVASFTDIASGRKDNRAQYQAMLDFVRAGHADVIAVQFLDRFGRNPREILRRVWELQESGIEIVATDEDIREELVLLVRAGLAGAESKRTSERVRATMRDAARRGRRGGTPPYGYRAIREVVDGEVQVRYEHEPHEVHTIRRAIELIENEGLGYLRLAERLEAEGLRTRGGIPWSAASVHQVLNNEALRGAYVLRQKGQEPVTIEAFYGEPVLSDAEWAALRERLDVRRNRTGRANSSDYLLSGVLRCGYCGGPMQGQHLRSRGRDYWRYICGNRLRNKAFCEHWNNHAMHRLNNTVIDALGEYMDAKRVRELMGASKAKSKDTDTKRLEAVERDLAKLDADLRADIERMNRGILDERDFATVNAGRRERRAALEAEHARLAQAVEAERMRHDTVATLPQRVASFLEIVKSSDVRRAKAALQLLLKAVHVTRDGIELEWR